MNNADALTCQGSATDAAGTLILTGGWDLVVEEIDHGKVVRHTSLKPAAALAGDLLPIAQIAKAETPWHWDAQGQLTHAGNYRFTLSYAGVSTSSELIHVDTSLEPPPWITVTVTPERTQLMLGEPLAVTYRVANHGVDDYHVALGSDYEFATRALRFAFTAERDDGVRASDPEPLQYGGGGFGEDGELKPGDAREQTVPLNAYLRFPDPGTWRVTAYHAMGFGTPVPAGVIACVDWMKHYARAGTFTLVVAAPDPAKAAAIIARGLAAASPNAGEQLLGSREILDHLHEPYYLPALRAAMADATPEQVSELMDGIASIETTEATSALIDWAAHAARLEVRQAALNKLLRRLPEPPPPADRPPHDPSVDERERLRALAASRNWSEDLRPGLLQAVVDALASGKPELIGPAANILGVAGGAEAGELLVHAAEGLAPGLPIAVARYPALGGLWNAVWQLSRDRSLRIAATTTSSPGRLLCWVRTLSEPTRTPQEEALLAAMVRMPDSMLRFSALQCMRPDEAARLELPWLELFTDPCAGNCNVRWLALQVSRTAAPATIKAALLGVPTAIWDAPSNHEDFERRMREVSAPAKQAAP